MKKIIIAIICFFFLGNVNAQVADTAIYINQLVANKSLYVGKPFSYLEQNLKIKLKFFSPLQALSFDKTKETHTSFGFLYPLAQQDFSFPRFFIYWTVPLNATNSLDLYTKYDRIGWAPETSVFYANAIIKDIRAD